MKEPHSAHTPPTPSPFPAGSSARRTLPATVPAPPCSSLSLPHKQEVLQYCKGCDYPVTPGASRPGWWRRIEAPRHPSPDFPHIYLAGGCSCFLRPVCRLLRLLTTPLHTPHPSNPPVPLPDPSPAHGSEGRTQRIAQQALPGANRAEPLGGHPTASKLTPRVSQRRPHCQNTCSDTSEHVLCVC